MNHKKEIKKRILRIAKLMKQIAEHIDYLDKDSDEDSDDDLDDDEEEDEDDYVDLSKAKLTPIHHTQPKPVNFLSEIEPKELKRQLEPQQAIKQEIKPVKPLIKIEGLEETTDEIVEPQNNEIVLDQHEHYDKCPLCSGKLKKGKVKEFSDGLEQSITCKTKGCKFSKTYKIAL